MTLHNPKLIDIDRFRTQFVLSSIEKEILDLKNNNIPFSEEYIEHEKKRSGLHRRSKEDILKNEKEDVNNFYDSSMKNSFRVEWSRMKSIHKQMKIKEYVQNLKYDKKIKKNLVEKNKNDLYESIIKAIEKKKFNGDNRKYIKYNKDTMLLESIENVEKNNDGLYYLEF